MPEPQQQMEESEDEDEDEDEDLDDYEEASAAISGAVSPWCGRCHALAGKVGEEEKHAVLQFVLQSLSEGLLTKLLEGFHS
jgi:hypothetical protein